MTMNPALKDKTFDFTITHNFATSRENVFKAWTKSRHLIHWWGPEGFTMPVHKMDIHPGGIYRCDLKGPDGKDHWVLGVFTELVEPSHLAFTHSWNENGKHTPETHIAVELTEDNGITNMVFYQSGFESEIEKQGHIEGWNSSFKRLEKYLAANKDF